MTDDEVQEVLRHFHSIPEFGERSQHWSEELTQWFCRLVHAIHTRGLDLYNVGIRGQIRFGRKNRDAANGRSVAGYIGVTNDNVSISKNETWSGYEAGCKIEAIDSQPRFDLDERLVRKVENELKKRNCIRKDLRVERVGLWPDDYLKKAPEDGQEIESGSAETFLDHFLNTILHGPPGTGKTYATFRRCVEICDGTVSAKEKSEKEVSDRYHELVEEGRVEFVTFHQSYGYEEFVEGLRPQTRSTDTDGDGSAGFRLDSEDGVLKRIADRARSESAAANPHPYVLVIDEINRGNISKVFGEAITLVETDKRSGKPHEISVTLPYSGERFTLPANLYILGTMNTADRSIALLDTALRRRFDFVELAPDPKRLGTAEEKSGIDLPAVLTAMNERLEWLLSRDHLIGHAWLMDVESEKDVNDRMRHKIIPLLAEYFHEDWRRVRAVLGGGDGFIERKKLDVPKLDDTDTGEDRYRWTVRKEFAKDAYVRLIDGKARKTDANDDGADEDSG